MITTLAVLLIILGSAGAGWGFGWIAGYKLGKHRGVDVGRGEAIIGSIRERAEEFDRRHGGGLW